MVVSLFDRSGSRTRAPRRRRVQARRTTLAIDRLESRRALAITGPLSIGGNTLGTYFDAPTGVASLGDFVTVSIEGTRGTVVFNGGTGVQDGTDIQTIEILNASPDFQLTFNASVTMASPVTYSSDGVVHMGRITTANVIRGINTVRGPAVNVAAPWEVETSAIHLYTFNDGTVSGTSVRDLVGGADGTLFNGATVSNGQLVLADNSGATGANVQYMKMPDGIVPDGTTAATFELWFTASSSSGTWGRGFDLGLDDQQYLVFTPVKGGGGSRAAITEASSGGERQVDGGTSYNDNLQHLATVTVDDAANTLAYFIDGALVGTVSLDGTNLSGLEAVNNFLGRSQFAVDPGFIGSMNQFAIYDRALTPTEILENYAAGPIAGPLTPLGFTQTSAGSNTLLVEGDQTAVFPVNTFVSAAPLLPTTGAASYGTVQSVSFDSDTNVTTMVLSTATAAGTTAGALTLAETVQPEFRLTSFVGVNFSSSRLREWGGLFVDVVEGADTVVAGQPYTNLGILLSNGLLPYSTIGIRRELAATVVLGTTSRSSTDGRLLIASATPESLIYVGPRALPVGTNSRLELIGGAGPFGASVLVNQNFIGTMNIASAATGQFVFSRGVGPSATLNAAAWSLITVSGDFAGRINSTGFDFARAVRRPFAFGDVRMTVSRNVTGSARVNAASNADVLVGGNVLKGAVISANQDVFLAVVGNASGSVQSGSFGNLVASVAGSVVQGGTFAAGGNAAVSVGRNFDGSVTSRTLRFFVNGNVSQASRIVARSVSDWLGSGTANFGIGGRLDGIVNVGYFDASPDYAFVTLVGGGAGSTARFNVERFDTDSLVFNGNFAGNLRVLQDLRADLWFNGNVHRITIGGRVGSYDVDPVTQVITLVPVAINVTGRLAFLNSNSYFQAAVPGRTGTFWNDSTKTSATGLLFTGGYGKVVPTLQQVTPPFPPTPQAYTVPGTPGGFSASQVPSQSNIQVTFTAPTSTGGLPVVYYEYTTDNGGTWRRFPTKGQQPATDIPLNVDSSGLAFTSGTYLVAVRAVNAVGASVATTARSVTIPA